MTTAASQPDEAEWTRSAPVGLGPLNLVVECNEAAALAVFDELLRDLTAGVANRREVVPQITAYPPEKRCRGLLLKRQQTSIPSA